MNFTEFLKCPVNFVLKFGTLILTEKLQSHFFAVTDTQTQSVLFRVRISNSPVFPFNSCFNIVHSLNVLQFNHKTYQ